MTGRNGVSGGFVWRAEVLEGVVDPVGQRQCVEFVEVVPGGAGEEFRATQTQCMSAAGGALEGLIGHRDRIVPWQDVLRLSPRVSVHHFVDAGHMPQWDDGRSVASVLLDAIARSRR